MSDGSHTHMGASSSPMLAKLTQETTEIHFVPICRAKTKTSGGAFKKKTINLGNNRHHYGTLIYANFVPRVLNFEHPKNIGISSTALEWLGLQLLKKYMVMTAKSNSIIAIYM